MAQFSYKARADDNGLKVVSGGRKVDDEVTLYTGNGSDPYNPDPTAISLSGSAMTFEFTSRADDPQLRESRLA